MNNGKVLDRTPEANRAGDPLELFDMIRTLLLVLVAVLATQPCFGGFYQHAGDKDLSELKKMKGVFMATREGTWAEDLFMQSRNQNLVGFTIGWLVENDLLGKGFVEKFKAEIPNPVPEMHPFLEAVLLYGVDASGRTVFVTPLNFQEISGGELAPQIIDGAQYTRIQFSIDKSLIAHSFIRFHEYIGIHASQWTDVYLGQKPVPAPPVEINADAPVIPGLAPIPGASAP